MPSYKFKCDNFKNFIRDSKNKIENSLYGIECVDSKRLKLEELNSQELRIIRNLEVLTQEDKIIWSKDSEDSYRGVVMENCTFSDYRILISKEVVDWDESSYYGCDYLTEVYRISFIKGLLTFEKIEYFSDAFNSSDDIINRLLEAINKKLVQQQN